jgi:hypothetical protein
MHEIDSRLINADGSIDHEVARTLAVKARSEAFADHRLAVVEAARGVIDTLLGGLAGVRSASKQSKTVPQS